MLHMQRAYTNGEKRLDEMHDGDTGFISILET